jgi:hypothetical protein
MFSSVLDAVDWIKMKISDTGGPPPPRLHNDPFFLFFLGYKYDEASLMCVLPRDILGVIMSHAWWCRPLHWCLTNSPHSQLTFTDENRTAQALVAGYRCQPFFSSGAFEEQQQERYPSSLLFSSPNASIAQPLFNGSTDLPLSRGLYFFRYKIEMAKTSTTMEIGVVDAKIFCDSFSHQDTDCSNLSIRDNSAAFLFSWNGGAGRLFGCTANGTCYGGYKPREEMIMELDLRHVQAARRQLLFYHAGANWKSNFSPFRQDVAREKGELSILAKFWGLPESVVPVAYLLGSGYETKVTLIDVVALI